jgi:sigma-B regulation protein RsbU (phosphoserine phosphatase)
MRQILMQANPYQPVDVSEELNAALGMETQRLKCLSVWGGNGMVDTELRSAGMTGWVWSKPADGGEGGDVYLASLCGRSEIHRYVVADVTGHGADAAVWARRLESLMRSHINTQDQTRFSRELGDAFHGLESRRFATAVLATFLPATGQFVVCNAGHPRPLWYEAATRSWNFLPFMISGASNPVRNLPLGVVPGTDYFQYEVRLRSGDFVMLYTDGLTEARDVGGAMLDEQGFLEVVRSVSVKHQGDFLGKFRSALAGRLGPVEFVDDVTIFLLTPAGTATPTKAALV